jgi:hypothetical protein
MVPTVAMAIVMGIAPGFFMRPMEVSVNRIIERVTGQQPAQVNGGPGASALGARHSALVDGLAKTPDLSAPEHRTPNAVRRPQSAGR